MNEKRKYDSTVARIAGNIASGVASAILARKSNGSISIVDEETVAHECVSLARAASMLIVANLSRPPFDIGVTRRGLSDGDGKWHADQPFVLVREVTQADWLAFIVQETGREPSRREIETTVCDRFFEAEILVRDLRVRW